MRLGRPPTFLSAAAVVPLAALAIAGCGGSDNGNSNGNGSSSSASATPPKTTSGRSATVGVDNESIGKILVDSKGRTLYLFQKDQGTKSACSGACAAAWPPLRATGKPLVGAGAKTAMVGTTRRSDGKPQVTYNGHPLYTYSGDQNPGDTTGQGLNVFGALWYVVSPSGNANTSKASNSGGGSVY